MDELQRYYKESLLANLCGEYKGYWQKAHGNKEELMRLVLSQQSAAHFATFCYQGKGLTKDYCKQEFGDYINGRVFNDCEGVKGFSYGMYIDVPQVEEMALDVSQFLWCDDTNVSIPQTKCPRLYVSNRSNLNISLDGYNSIAVYLFDESTINIEDADEESKVIIYKYSKDAKVELGKYCFADVKVFDKELRL